jgi:class 3 adenylate cyclase/tetratricopeptide (TPR) repeat protein
MTVASADLSGFTRLTERLSTLGRRGAEAMTLQIEQVFGPMIDQTHRLGGDVVCFGGDALLVAFDGDGHEARAVAAVDAMRRSLARQPAVVAPGGKVKLRMSIGVNTGDFVSVITSGRTRQFVLIGASATRTVELESRADAGQILVSSATARGAGADRFHWVDDGCALLVRPAAPCADVVVDDHDDDVAAAFVPPWLTMLLADRNVEPDHRHVAVSFIHLPDLDARLGERGIDEVTAHVDHVARSIEHQCDQFGVSLTATDIATDGVKFLLMAGWPHRTVDDAARMAWCLRSIEDLHPGLLRIGAHWGPVYAGQVGTDARRTASVMGDAVNTAARLCGKATAGRVVISGVLADRIAGELASTYIADLPLKGKRSAVPTYALGGPSNERIESLDPASLGRADELAHLVAMLQVATCGTGGVAVIEASAGLGGSQLVSAIRGRAGDAEVVEAGRDLGVGASDERRLRRLFSRLLRVDGVSAPTAGLGQTATELEDRLGLVERFLGGDGDDLGGTAVEHRASALADALTLLVAAARPASTVVIVEDIDGLGPLSTLLLERLCTAAASRPWFVLLTAESHLSMVDAVHAQVLALAPLPVEATADVVLQAAGDVALADDVLNHIVARSGGNPLFGWMLGRESSAVDVMPESLEALFGQRVDAVGPAQRRALRAAAIVGESAERRLISAVMGDDVADDLWLDCARVVAVDGDRIVFHHRLLHDAVYDGMAFGPRNELHARLARVLIAEHADDPGETGRQAYLGHLWSDAAHWCAVAGRAAEQVGALADAHTHFRRAVDASQKADGFDASTQSLLLEGLARTAELLGRGGDAIGAYVDAAMMVPDDAVRSIDLYCRAARRAATMDARRRASRLLGRAARHIDARAVTDRHRRIVELERAFLLLQNGRYEMARRRLVQLIPNAEADGDHASAGVAYSQLEWALSAVGDPASAQAGRRGLQLLELTGDDTERAFLLLNMSSTALSRGDWTDAVDLAKRAETALSRLGDARAAAGAVLNLAGVLAEQGRLADARTASERSRRICRASAFPLGDLVARATLARIRGWQGEPVPAAAELAEVAAGFDALHVPEQALLTRIFGVEVLGYAGEVGAAQDAIEEVEAQVRQCGPADIAPVTFGRCRAVMEWLVGGHDAALEQAVSVIAQARSQDAISEVAMTLDLQIQMSEQLGSSVDDDIRAEHHRLAAHLGIERFLRLPRPVPSALRGTIAAL